MQLNAPLGSLVLAALALPGVAHAESAPEQGLVGLRFLNYQDSQPGWKRITVNSPSFLLVTPLGTGWGLEATATVDHVSGATPRYHSNVSGASTMDDERKAGDVKVTRYFQRASLSLGGAYSTEHDYLSRAFSLAGTWSSDDNNTTWNAGFGHAGDKIDPTDGGYDGNVADERKRTNDFIVGVTQAVTGDDLVQANLTHSRSTGYLDDPYKALDRRPSERRQTALLLRWNHHFAGDGSTLRSSYRAYNDSWQVKASTLQLEWVKPVGGGVSLTPLLRYYTQSAASFYADPVYDTTLGEPFPVGWDANATHSLDQRLSAFGAFTLGLKLQWAVDALWTVDLKGEAYQQRGEWRAGGEGSKGLEPFKARMLQVGISRKF
ncbi:MULTISPECIES: DUF3570 domain-containing protein [unclassified Rhizobacter]|uniref:DUF3570 domain-containing protein n=1 Tax=unclassified Rhizobacter TaxID=2640088 RepID=UPI0006F4E532|nr:MULTISPECIES: DUF3570 domain-containing protein [unclassified Rhizobacter]KQU64435.1 hypothetical protein ASC88_12105 [Rhizobacter sp. Root29]KQW11489.1 hypothetical protein ASC98_21305 [Rhizobacter sp. Root1238]KRB19746.1 hypothetical protein ASE08_23130 [Rhizobacter sp. Root16D2]